MSSYKFWVQVFQMLQWGRCIDRGTLVVWAAYTNPPSHHIRFFGRIWRFEEYAMHLQVEASNFSQHEIQPCTPLHLRLPTQTSRRFPTETGFFDMLRLHSRTNSSSSIRLSLKSSRSIWFSHPWMRPFLLEMFFIQIWKKCVKIVWNSSSHSSAGGLGGWNSHYHYYSVSLRSPSKTTTLLNVCFTQFWWREILTRPSFSRIFFRAFSS